MLRKFLRDESGATAIEYGLICGAIALAIIAAVGLTGEKLVALFESLIPALSRYGKVPGEASRQGGPPHTGIFSFDGLNAAGGPAGFGKSRGPGSTP